jgi:hypothetical protein
LQHFLPAPERYPGGLFAWMATNEVCALESQFLKNPDFILKKRAYELLPHIDIIKVVGVLLNTKTPGGLCSAIPMRFADVLQNR